MVLKSYFITGANKGIGLETVKRILIDVEDSFLYLGSRKASDGHSAIEVTLFIVENNMIDCFAFYSNLWLKINHSPIGS